MTSILYATEPRHPRAGPFAPLCPLSSSSFLCGCASPQLFMRNPRFLGYKFGDMSKPESLEKKYFGKMSKRALSFMKVVPHSSGTPLSCRMHDAYP